ncbi:MAG: glycosyltransferase family 9 protein [Rhodocyclaceae bacterium]|nr:glycosyltransferase family 9 protein [Rhodocyclaceae bacterium]MBX3669572.1 glycosyltransferase family 9 protein [Rhodocyclaceae bacterium]
MMDLPAQPRILVINVTRIGDTLLTTPVLRALARHWPGAKITFAGHRKRAEVMQNLDFVERVSHISKRTAPFVRLLARSRYDLAVVFGNDEPLIRYARACADRVIAARQDDAALNRELDWMGCADEYKPQHAVTHLLCMLRPLRIKPDGFHLSYRVRASEAQWADAQLAARRIAGVPLLGLQIASFPTKAFRDWPTDHFRRLCLTLGEMNPDLRFLVFGGPTDQQRADELCKALGGTALSVAGQLSLRQTAALMDKLALYVGVDTGPTHIMGALHRPMVAMYHPTSPSRVLAPLGHPCCIAVDHPLAAGGADIETPMAEISVATILDSVERAFAGRFDPPHQTEWDDYQASLN